jgi:hypothetical protein
MSIKVTFAFNSVKLIKLLLTMKVKNLNNKEYRLMSYQAYTTEPT